MVGSRTIAQLVGGEQIYTGTLSSLWHVLRIEGIRGLYCGLQPALLGEALHVSMITMLQQLVSWGLTWVEGPGLPAEEPGPPGIEAEKSPSSSLSSPAGDSDAEDNGSDNDEVDITTLREQEEAFAVHLGELALSLAYYPYLLVSVRMQVLSANLAANKYMPPVQRNDMASVWQAARAAGGWGTLGLLAGAGLLRRTIPAPASV